MSNISRTCLFRNMRSKNGILIKGTKEIKMNKWMSNNPGGLISGDCKTLKYSSSWEQVFSKPCVEAIGDIRNYTRGRYTLQHAVAFHLLFMQSLDKLNIFHISIYVRHTSRLYDISSISYMHPCCMFKTSLHSPPSSYLCVAGAKSRYQVSSMANTC